mgnify:CR=1 FL=1
MMKQARKIKVVIAMDSMKGSLSSLEAGRAAAEGIRLARPEARIVVKPLADGGEGTVEALTAGLGGEFVTVPVHGPLGEAVTARYGILPDGTAVMEMAEASGLTLVPGDRLDPWRASTYGTGEMIRDALGRGCRDFLIGIGGSATTDGGTGMLAALGYEFLDSRGQPAAPGIGELDRIDRICAANRLPELEQCSFRIACDVSNPLLGEQGAVWVYGPQKGVREEEKPVLDAKMLHFAEKTVEYTGKDCRNTPGAGAAGGLGFAFLSYFPEARLQPGAELVLEILGLEREIAEADFVVTGEGRLDAQTSMGKAPAGIAQIAKKYGKRVIAFAGQIAEDAGACRQAGIDACFSILPGVLSLEEAMHPETAEKNLKRTAEQVFRLL